MASRKYLWETRKSLIDRSLNYGRPLIRKFLEESGPLASVLDMGAGSGDDLQIARDLNPKAKLYGVDNLPVAMKNLRKRGIQVLPLNIERDPLPLKDISIDAVIQNQILEHAKELFWILHEATRVLKVGGSLIVGIPNLASLHNRFLLICGRSPTVIKTLSAHVRGFTKHDFNVFIHEVWPGGYRLEGFGGANFYPFPPFLAKPLAKLFATFSWGIFFRLVKQKPYKGEFLEYLRLNPFETNFYTGPKRSIKRGGR
jgi:SAM-dependent methyltransferase